MHGQGSEQRPYTRRNAAALADPALTSQTIIKLLMPKMIAQALMPLQDELLDGIGQGTVIESTLHNGRLEAVEGLA